MIFKPSRSLPLLMYHYINDMPNSIAVSIKTFEEHCKILAEAGWRGVGLQEAEAYFIHGEPLAKRSVLFTFDDGYLDNYIFALPLLRKYGHRGVVCAVSSKIEPDNCPRASLKELEQDTFTTKFDFLNHPVNKNTFGFLERRDTFCNVGELRAMEESGIMQVAAHSMNHRGVFISQEYTDFIQPKNQKRTFYTTHVPSIWGLPAFKTKSGLLHRAFIPSDALIEAIGTLVPQKTEEALEFFAQEANVVALRSLVAGFKGEHFGRYETDAERSFRMQVEIVEGKHALEAMLGHNVSTMCWPWGVCCEEALRIGREAGFSVFWTTQEGINPPNKPFAVKRFKAKEKSGNWLLNRTRLYSFPLLGSLYSRIRL